MYASNHCAFCPALVPPIPQATEEGWEPSFYLDGSGDEICEPICPDCFLYFMQFNPEFGDYEMRPYLIDRMGYGEVQPVKLDPRIRDLLERVLSVIEEDDEHGDENWDMVEEIRCVLGKKKQYTLLPSEDLVDEGMGCPACGERRTDRLEFVFNKDNVIECQSCGHVFEGDDWAWEEPETESADLLAVHPFVD